VINKKYTLGIVGVRGYVGRELLGLLANHSNIHVDWLSSRQLEGTGLVQLLKSDENFKFDVLSKEHYFHQIKIEKISAEKIAKRKTDIVILALPNGLAAPFVDAIEKNNNCQLIIDLSADYRFDSSWLYSLPELINSDKLNQYQKNKLIKISNPGCYATAMQIALAPLIGKTQGRVNCFGMSGFSGAGTKPSPNNDPSNLKNNILPYALLEHLHEKEVSYQLGLPISFSPHIVEFFRGITMTIQVEFEQKWQLEDVRNLFKDFYQECSAIKIIHSIPNIQQVVYSSDCIVGGFTLSNDGKRLTFVSCLDNLLKGAASQALQNIELALNC